MGLRIDLDYDPASYAGEFSEDEMRAFEQWLQKCRSPQIRFDPEYLQHMRSHHGGIPRMRYFQAQKGTSQVIIRFLNFLPEEANGPLVQYRVEGTWGLIEDRLGTFLIPFAELFGGDMLCFDYSTTGNPGVVFWDHERSREGRPYTEPVASNFTHFLSMLSAAKQ
jgi:hypothetical protein